MNGFHLGFKQKKAPRYQDAFTIIFDFSATNFTLNPNNNPHIQNAH